MEIKPIPFSDNFYASEDGRIFDSSGNERTQYENGDGYKTASIRIAGKWITFGVQRLVALAFIPTDNPEDLTVNHIDLNKTNNHRTNLEWLTAEMNNLHAALFRKNPVKPIAYTVSDAGSKEWVYSIQELETRVGTSALAIWAAIKASQTVNGFKVVPFTKKTKIPLELKKLRRNGSPAPFPVKVMDLENGTIAVYESMTKVAESFQVARSLVSLSLIVDDKIQLFCRKFIIVGIDDDFPKVDKSKILEVSVNQGIGVIAYNFTLGRYEIFSSASSFIRRYNLSKKAITVSLKKEQIRIVDGFAFVYNNQKQKQLLSQFVKDRSGS
jgi:hypothetical protein